MAKQLVNPIERHIEKAVLGIAGLILIGVIAKYLVTSPNKLDLGGETVTPKTIDAHVARKAEAVRQRLREEQPKEVAFEPVVNNFVKKLAETKVGVDLPAALALGPDVPIIDRGQAAKEKNKIVTVLPLPKPTLTSGRMLIATPDGAPAYAEGRAEIETNWVTVSSIMDRAKQSEIQQNVYGSRFAGVIFGPTQVQRRERRADGSWADEDWKSIVAWPAAPMKKTPELTVYSEGGQSLVDRDAVRAVEKYREGIEAPRDQLEFLRPMPLAEKTAPTWKFPVLTSIRDLAMQEDTFLFPDQPAQPNPTLTRWLYLDDVVAQPVAVVVEPTNIKELTKKRLAEIEDQIKQAEKNKNSELATLAHNAALEIEESNTSSASDKQKAATLRKKAEQVRKDIEYGDKTPDNRPSPTGDTVKVAREPLPKQQVWVHDSFPGSVLPGKTYQYRLRTQIFNRLVGYPERFETPTDAQVVFVEGPWSEPSDPITIEPPAHVFLTQADSAKELVTVELYKWYRAVWVTTRQKLKIGETVDIEDRVDTPDPANPLEVYAAKVPFRMDAMVLDIDFDRVARERKAERGGVRFLAPERTAAVVFVDSAGQLQERVEALDRNDAARNLVKSRVWKAPKGKK